MDAGTLNLKTIFGQDRRYLVPLFQRPYVWKREEQWEPLWDDIRGVADRLLAGQKARPHFLGAIVLDHQPKPTGQVETRLVIDGQQRLTTVQILLEALYDYCDRPGLEKYHRSLAKLTRNEDPLSEDPDEEFKVWPTNTDREHFRRVMRHSTPDALLAAYDRGPKDQTIGHPIGDGYLYFSEAIETWIEADSDPAGRIDVLLQTLMDYMRMVVIDLGKEDDAQLIFETLNARGTPLLPSDLVKNYLFYRLQAEDADIGSLYTKYWAPFDRDAKYWREELGRGHARRARVDLFLMYFLTLKTRDEVAAGHLYTAFQQYVEASGVSTESHLAALAAAAAAFQKFDNLQKGTREYLFFERLRAMDVTTPLPVLLWLFVEHARDRARLGQVLQDLESFLVRRMVCRLSARGYNRLFVEMLKAIDYGTGDFADRVRAFLLGSDAESNRWPGREEFRQAWLTTPVYDVLVRARTRMLLEGLERELHTGLGEKVDFGEKLTVEHLMPQEWRKHWPLPENVPAEQSLVARERAIHCIGNLTLVTGKLNPTLSNGPWHDKRPVIHQHSVLRTNRPLTAYDHWDEGTIQARGEELFDVACRIWPKPGSKADTMHAIGALHSASSGSPPG